MKRIKFTSRIASGSHRTTPATATANRYVATFPWSGRKVQDPEFHAPRSLAFPSKAQKPLDGETGTTMI